MPYAKMIVLIAYQQIVLLTISEAILFQRPFYLKWPFYFK